MRVTSTTDGLVASVGVAGGAGNVAGMLGSTAGGDLTVTMEQDNGAQVPRTFGVSLINAGEPVA